ncbi:hypothetical protein ACJX0J_010124, partial [Zea mays]
DAKEAPLTTEEVGRATWMLLHTIAGSQRKRDAKELMHIISRLYPCKECAGHFKKMIHGVSGMLPPAWNYLEFGLYKKIHYDLANLGLELSNFYCQNSQISGTEIKLIWGNCTSELFHISMWIYRLTI